MGKAFRRALDRRGNLRRNVSHRTMMSNVISLLLELKAASEQLEDVPEALAREFSEFEQAATAYLRGEL